MVRNGSGQNKLIFRSLTRPAGGAEALDWKSFSKNTREDFHFLQLTRKKLVFTIVLRH
jgi:phage terminase large subunit-like protein